MRLDPPRRLGLLDHRPAISRTQLIDICNTQSQNPLAMEETLIELALIIKLKKRGKKG